MRVVIVDDEPDVRLLYRLKLEEAGHDVLEAGDGEEGLSLIRDARPDVAVVDVMLPLLDGFGVVEQLQDGDAPPLLLSSARVSVVDQLRGLHAGAIDYLPKPCDLGHFLTIVERAGTMSRQDREIHRRSRIADLEGRSGGATDAAGPRPVMDRRVASVLDLAVDAIVSVDQSQQIVGFNKGAEVLFGYVAEEVLGKPLDILLPRSVAADHGKHVERFGAAPEQARLMGERREINGRRRDGSEFPAEASIVKLDVDGRPTYTAILRDATERKRIETELRRRARQQAAVAELGQRALEAAPVHELITAATSLAADALGVDHARVELTVDEGASAPHVARTLRSTEPVVFEDLEVEGYRSGAGVIIPGQARPFGALLAYSRDGHRFAGDDLHFLRSIANVLAAALVRERTEARLRRFLDAAPDATVVVDAEGRIVSANRQSEVLFGHPVAELVGMSVTNLVPDSTGTDVRARRRDGTDVPVDIMQSPIDTEEGPLIVAAVRDVTERRRTEAVRDSFLHAVSHELRTPLAAVVGFAELLVDGADTFTAEKRLELAQRVLTNGRKLERLLGDLLDLDRLARGVVEPRRRTTDVGETLHALLTTLSLGDHAVSIEMEREPLVAEIDPAQFERIVENLLANLVRHTPPGTKATVSARRGPNGLLVAVEDDGPGVPESLRAEIFEPFRRGQAGSTVAGTGIGLSLVARFAELHGGRAWVDESAAGGAAFKVLLADA